MVVRRLPRVLKSGISTTHTASRIIIQNILKVPILSDYLQSWRSAGLATATMRLRPTFTLHMKGIAQIRTSARNQVRHLVGG